MAVTAFLFTKYFASKIGGVTAGETRKIDWLSDDMKIMLTTSSWVPDRDVHQFKSDVTNEITGTGYSAGGLSLSAKTVVVDGATHSVRLDCADPAWAGATFTARRAAIYDNREAADANRELVGYIDFGQDESVSGATFTIQVAAEGLVKEVGG